MGKQGSIYEARLPGCSIPLHYNVLIFHEASGWQIQASLAPVTPSSLGFSQG